MKRALDVCSDAFGLALLDHLEGRGGHELIERSDGYIGLSAGAETYFAEPSGQQRGHDAVGIDVSPLAIEVCRRRGLRVARALSVEEVDSSLELRFVSGVVRQHEACRS